MVTLSFLRPTFMIAWSKDMSDHQSTKQTRSIGYCSCYAVKQLFLWIQHFLRLLCCRKRAMIFSTDFFETKESRVVGERRTALSLKLRASWHWTFKKVTREVHVWQRGELAKTLRDLTWQLITRQVQCLELCQIRQGLWDTPCEAVTWYDDIKTEWILLIGDGYIYTEYIRRKR